MKKILFTSLAVLSVAASHAVVAFSTYGPGQSVDTTTGWTIGYLNNQRVAHQFESQASGVLESVTFTSFNGADGEMDVLLYEDDNGTVGSLIVGWDVLSQGINEITQTLPNLFPSIELTAGQKYWLEIAPASPGVWAGWNLNDQGINLNTRFMSDMITGEHYTITPASAFQVNVVPEPATLALLALAPLALKRRKKA